MMDKIFKILMMKSCCFETGCMTQSESQTETDAIFMYAQGSSVCQCSVCSSWRRNNQNKHYFFIFVQYCFLFEFWTLISKAGLERFLHTYFSLVQNMWNSDFECCWYLQTSKAAQKWFNSGSEARHGSEAGGGSLDRHGTETGGAAAAEIMEATRSIVTSMAGYHGRLVAQAIATTYR